MIDSAAMRVRFLGMYGLHGRAIARIVKRIDGTSYPVSQIYRELSKAGIRLRDWRDGKGDEVRSVISAAAWADVRQPVFRAVRGKKPISLSAA
jgi:hypothetical protein